MVVRPVFLALVLTGATMLAGPARAQQDQPQPADDQGAAPAGPVSADPASTSASYGDWALRCQRIGEADKARRLCEVSQSIQSQNRRATVAQIALGHLPTDKSLHLTTVVPPSISFPSTVQLTTTEKMPRSIDLQWRRCVPGGCFAEATPSDELIQTWRGLSDAGRITFKDAAGREVSLPFSFRGLAQALDALGKS